jgi:hypothetical protein
MNALFAAVSMWAVTLMTTVCSAWRWRPRPVLLEARPQMGVCEIRVYQEKQT